MSTLGLSTIRLESDTFAGDTWEAISWAIELYQSRNMSVSSLRP